LPRLIPAIFCLSLLPIRLERSFFVGVYPAKGLMLSRRFPMKQILITSMLALGIGCGAAIAQTQPAETQSGGDTNCAAGAANCQKGSKMKMGEQVQGKPKLKTDEQAQGKAKVQTDQQAQGKAKVETDQQAQGKAKVQTDQQAQGKAKVETDQQAQGKANATTNQQAQGKANAQTDQQAQGKPKTRPMSRLRARPRHRRTRGRLLPSAM